MTNKFTRGDGEDVWIYCAGVSGGTFPSRRGKTACPLRQHSIDVAQKPKDYPFPDANGPNRQSALECKGGSDGIGKSSRRFNESFHNYRFLVVMFGGLSFGLMLLMRLNISVAILNMVNQTALYIHEHPHKTVDDFLAEGYQMGGDFNWDNEIQNMIMSWYMIAYTLPQVVTTKLGLIAGSRLTVAISLSICALATLLTPISAYLGGWKWVIVLRLINGVGASAVIPMMLNLIENWMPYSEITLGLTIGNTIQALISSLSPLIAGYLSSIHWNYAFYVPALVALLFCIVWLVLISDRPDENWLISQKELDLICGCNKENSQQNGDQGGGCKTTCDVVSKERTAPEADQSEQVEEKPTVFDILKVPSFYGYLVCYSLHCCAFNGFLFILPAYLRQFLKIDISENGLYCSIIQSGYILAMMWPHPVSHILQSQLKLSLTATRRITYGIGCSVVALTWIYVGSFHQYQLVLLFIGRSFHGCNDVVLTGSLLSNYANAGLGSMAFSVVNTVGNLSVVFSSTLIGWYLDYSGQSSTGWFWILTSMGISQLIMMTVFAIVIRSDPIDLDQRKVGKKSSKSTNSTNDKKQGQVIKT